VNDEQKKYLVFGALILIISFLLVLTGYFLGSRVSDNGYGAQPVGEQLKQAGDNQQELTKGIVGSKERAEDVEGRIDRSQEAIDSAAERTGRVENNVTEAGELISQSQRILKNVRARGEVKKGCN